MQNVSELGLHHSKKDVNGKRGAKYHMLSHGSLPLFPLYLSWLPNSVCICNGQ
jgi:hypothetical protein